LIDKLISEKSELRKRMAEKEIEEKYSILRHFNEMQILEKKFNEEKMRLMSKIDRFKLILEIKPKIK
jgi:hypothetical protein